MAYTTSVIFAMTFYFASSVTDHEMRFIQITHSLKPTQIRNMYPTKFRW